MALDSVSRESGQQDNHKSSPYRFLIVDDDQMLIKLWSRAAKSKGWEVDIASTGVEALDALQKNDGLFDVVMTDLMMPGMDGLELLDKIQEVWPEQQVLMVTGYATDDRAVEAIVKGAAGYLQKTCGIDELCHALESLGEKNRLRLQNQLLALELQKRHEELQTQNQVLSALRELSFIRNERISAFLEPACKRLLELLGANQVCIVLQSDGVQDASCSGDLVYSWKGTSLEEEVLASQQPISRLTSDCYVGEPNPDEPTFCMGIPVFDLHQHFLGVLTFYFPKEKKDSHTFLENLFTLISREIGGLVSSLLSEIQLSASHESHKRLADFNRELLIDFRSQQQVNELDLYRRIFDQIISRDSSDQLPALAVVIREEGGDFVRALPFYRDNERGGFVVSSPGINSRHDSLKYISMNRSGVIYNQAPLPSDLNNDPPPVFPENFVKLVGEVRNFVACPLHPVKGSLGSLVLFNYGRPVRRSDVAIVMSYAVTLGFQMSIARESRERQRTQLVTMIKLAELAEKRDNETGAHLKRIAHYCRVLAEDLSAPYSPYQDEVNDAFIRQIYESSPLHDIGKVGIEDRILLKPGKLSAEEYELMKTHTTIGAQVLEGVPFLAMAQEIALCHHEKFDGTGYPRGLAGRSIPLAARIVAVADVYDALTSIRCYRTKAFTHEEARALILREYNKHFDPAIVDAFMRCEMMFKELKESYQGEDSALDGL